MKLTKNRLKFMPTVNLYFLEQTKTEDLQSFIPNLKAYLAEKLTCGDIKLTADEISIRFVRVSGGEMIAEVEVEITAHAFPDRVKKQDEICLDIMNYIKENVPSIRDVKVWLILVELGHSWE